jgi:ADP-ribosyl-[dinitrogen reductase] hydrolase
MGLALADSLVINGHLDPLDLITRFVAWWREGQYSCTGSCFDIGIATAQALARFEQSSNPFAGSTREDEAGNGSLMRLAPVALFCLHDADQADRLAREQSRTTHGAPQCLDACAFFVQLLREAILGHKDVFRPRTFQGHPAISGIAAGQWREKHRSVIRSGGYVADTLEAALWAVHRTTSFEEALVLAVNLGHDSDTVGAVTGQLAGALYGFSAIPPRWLATLAWRDRITATAGWLIRHPPTAGTVVPNLVFNPIIEARRRTHDAPPGGRHRAQLPEPPTHPRLYHRAAPEGRHAQHNPVKGHSNHA